ncbi:MAG: glycerophosphodiester phosphodiesterase [Elusimicrobia bacterium]|nr:glycerophosphodiester phosphodiesterase [Elusimicrobiota bacterium]
MATAPGQFFKPPPFGCWVIGHRGAMGVAPENTLASFQRGVAQGADFIELDVHLSRDGEAVVIHDDQVDRTTDGQGTVSALSVRELKRLDAGAWFGTAFQGERIPTLLEVLTWARSRRCWDGKPLGVIVELKTIRARIGGQKAGILHLVDRVMKTIEQTRMRKRIVVISFDMQLLRAVKRHHPEQSVGWLFSRRWSCPLGRATALHAQVLFPRFNRVSRRLVQAARREGLSVATWTVNTERGMARCLRLGVDAVATNYPGRLRQLLAD